MLAAVESRLRFPLLLRGTRLEVDIQASTVTYEVSRGDRVTARHDGEEFTVSAGAPVSFPGNYRAGAT